VRSGPGDDYEILAKVYRGDNLAIVGRDTSGEWLSVVVPNGTRGWVWRQYTNTNLAISVIPLAQAPPKPACSISVDGELSSAWTRDRLGCPTSAARIIWAAWQPFERGYMLWRDDTRRILTLSTDGKWMEHADSWDQVSPVPSRGNPPAGTQSPVRGFGYLWGRYDDVFNRLGWATGAEQGFCVKVQNFTQGLVMRSSKVERCQGDFYNWATHPDFRSLFFAIYDDGSWRKY
jgi:uncharacterized protein YraI